MAVKFGMGGWSGCRTGVAEDGVEATAAAAAAAAATAAAATGDV